MRCFMVRYEHKRKGDTKEALKAPFLSNNYDDC